MRSIIILIFTSIMLCGCVNNFEQFYVDVSQNFQGNYQLNAGEPHIIQGSNDMDADVVEMLSQGYVQIGYSSFQSGAAQMQQLTNQAKEVGAWKVLAYESYAGTVSGNIPITLPDTQTTYHSGNMNIYGNGGSAYGNYSGTSTTYGTKTTYMPYSSNRYDYVALYFARGSITIFGAHFRDLNQEEKRRVGSNTGVSVITPVDNTPAFYADVLPGDVITSINRIKFNDYLEFAAFLKEERGNEVNLEIWRDGRVLDKVVKLNP